MKRECDPYIDMYSQVFGIEPAETMDELIEEYNLLRNKDYLTREELKRYIWLMKKIDESRTATTANH
jgi:hypothetical protein